MEMDVRKPVNPHMRAPLNEPFGEALSYTGVGPLRKTGPGKMRVLRERQETLLLTCLLDEGAYKCTYSTCPRNQRRYNRSLSILTDINVKIGKGRDR